MRRLSIASIVSIVLVTATTLLLGLLGLVAYGSFRENEQAGFRRNNAILADQLATSLALPLWNFDQEQIGKVLDSVAPVRPVYSVVVRSATVPASVYARARDGNWRLQKGPAQATPAGLVTEERDIRGPDEVLGRVQVAFTPRFLDALVRQELIGLLGLIGLLDLMLVVGLYLLLWRIVLRPLQEVERYAVAVNSPGAPAGMTPERDYPGEIGSLRLALGRMVGLLDARFAALQKSETRYRLLAENVGDVIWTMDLAGRLTFVSPSVERLLGYKPEEVLPMPLEQLLAPASAAKLRALIQEIVRSVREGRAMKSGLIELENIDRHGASVWAENTYDCLRNPAGELTGILSVCRDITERRAAAAERERALQRESAARQEFTRKLIASQEAERHRIASELHDSLGQNLLLINNRAQLALAQPGAPAGVSEQVAGIADLARQAIAEVRQISHDLRPYQLDQLGLTRALQVMIDGAAESTGLRFACRLEPVDELFPGEAATQFYRIVQESLNNILKHAGATHVRIDLERDVHQVRLLVEDDGRGFEARDRAGPAGGFGLRNMTERVAMLGGQLALDSTPGAGTRLEVTVPIADPG